MRQGALAWLTMGRTFGYRDFDLDPEFFAFMTEEVERFWKNYIQGDAEPPSVTVDDVLLRNPRHQAGKSVIADQELRQGLIDLKDARDQLATLDARKKEIEAAVKMAMGDAEALLDPEPAAGKNRILATWKAAKDSQRFDEKRFAAEHPDLCEQYRHAVAGSRRLLIK